MKKNNILLNCMNYKNNIFEGAYFGKAYRTKDNTIVKFIMQRYADDFIIYIPKCKYSVETPHIYNLNGEFYLGNGEYGHSALDIVSEWQEPTDEEELDRLAHEYVDNSLPLLDGDAISCFKAGYRKALEK